MVDQVNPLGSLASGLPLTSLGVAGPKPVSEKNRSARTSEAPSRAGDPQPRIEESLAMEASSESAMDKVNSHLQDAGSELKFQVDKETGRTVFKVVNPKSGEVILQVPSEEMLALARNLRALDKQAGASGVLMDQEG